MSEKLRILIVEDNPADADFILELLPETGPVSFQTESVSRLAEALTRLESKGIDLVLLDLGLPDSQGLPTIQTLRKAVPDIPVIVLSGTNDDALATTAVGVGAQDYLVKGQFSGSLLMRAVRYALQRQKAEAALRESEYRWKFAIEGSSLGLWDWDVTAGTCLFSNRWKEMLGLAEDEVANTIDEWSKRIHPDELAPVMAAVQAHLDGTTPHYLNEHRVRCKDGSWKWILDRGLVVNRDAGGKPLRMIGTHSDITERKLAEEERARLAMAVEQAAETIVITDASGTILYANPVFENTSGYTRAEALGQNPRLLKSGRHTAEFYRQMWTVLERGQVWTGRLINKKKDGTLYEEDASISPMRDAAGKVVNYVAVKHDVTREVQLEAQLRQSQKMEAIGQLSGGVAHDFNNILTVIMMQAEITGMIEHLPEEIRQGLGHIRAAAERAANLTRQLLLFSRKQVMQPRELDLNEVVTNLAKMLQRIIGEHMSLQLNLHPHAQITRADPGMLDQMLMNLVVNARDAMPGGGRIIVETGEKHFTKEEAELIPDAKPGRHLSLRVTDTGCGIPPENLPRIFEPFFTTKEPGKGTGLGLATVFGIVKQHGGSLAVESEVGRGTTFQIYLPATETVGKSPGAAAVKPKPRGGTETILVVEDEYAVRILTRAVLEMFGYRVLEAADGVEAVRIWEQNQDSIRLLFTDLVMPEGVSGLELAARLQTRNPRLRVIFTSGYSAEIAGRQLSLQEGQNFIQKPSSPQQLLETVRRCLDT